MSANKKAPNCWHSIGAGQDNYQTHPVPIITRSPRHYKRRVRFRLTPANALLFLAILAALALLVWGAHEATDMILSYADDVSGVIG